MSSQNTLTLSGDWEKDEAIVRKFAEKPTSAAAFFEHARLVHTLFNRITWGTRFAPKQPQRRGLLKKIYAELYPIGHFAKLRFNASEDVVIGWRDGNQNFDATLEDRREQPNRSCLEFLEVTTLQDYEDSKVLEALANSPNGTSSFCGDQEYATHQRKLSQLRSVLKDKAGKNYPAGTALIVHTDEHRSAKFVFGVPAQEIDRKAAFGKVLSEMAPKLGHFAEVHVFSNNEIYCSIGETSTSLPDTASEAPLSPTP